MSMDERSATRIVLRSVHQSPENDKTTALGMATRNRLDIAVQSVPNRRTVINGAISLFDKKRKQREKYRRSDGPRDGDTVAPEEVVALVQTRHFAADLEKSWFDRFTCARRPLLNEPISIFVLTPQRPKRSILTSSFARIHHGNDTAIVEIHSLPERFRQEDNRCS